MTKKPSALIPMARLTGSLGGFSLVEAILSVSLFSLVVTALVGAITYSQVSLAVAGDRARAVMLAEEGLEAVRNIREEEFSLLTDGQHGLAIAGNFWVFSGVSDSTGKFNRVVSISTLNPSVKQVTSRVTWQQTLQRQGNVELVTYLTDWHKRFGSQADDLAVNISGAELRAGGQQLRGITLSNIGPGPITILTVSVSWDLSGKLIEDVRIPEGTRVWGYNGPGLPSGRQSSGVILDIQDVVLPAGATGVTTRFTFQGAMTGATFSIVFGMADGSFKTVSGIQP